VRVFLFGGEIDGLARLVTFRGRAMGEEARLRIGPQMRIQCRHALGRAHLNDGAPAALARAFEQRRKHILQALAFEVIEERFGHRASVTSVANSKFASAWATLQANFAFKATLAIY